MKKLLTLLVVCIAFCNISIAQVYGVPINRNDKLEIVEAADMVLDVNKFGIAHSALVLYGLPVNEEATDEFAKRFSKTWDEYRDYVATNAYIYWPELQRSPKDLLVGRLTSFGLGGSDIKELFFTLGETYRSKLLSDLPNCGYKKIKSEKKKDKKYNFQILETTYQKENHLCTIQTYGNHFTARFSRKVRQESPEEKTIAEQCERFIRLHAADGARQYDLTEENVPYEEPAVVDIQFPPENTMVDTSPYILSDKIINKTITVDISSKGKINIDSYDDKIRALFYWIKPFIKVESFAKVNFPRYGKGFIIGGSYDLKIRESEEEYDSCTILIQFKFKGYTYANAQYTLKNQKDVEEKLTSFYGNADLMLPIWESFPRSEIFDYSHVKSGNTYHIKVHIFRRKVTYTFNNKSATYMLPFVYIWGEPVKK